MKPAPYHPFRTIVPGEPGQYLLSRVLRVQSTLDEIDHIVILDRDEMRIVLRDSGPGGTPEETADRDSAIHLLWARDDEVACLLVNDVVTSVAPGDTLLLPAGTTWRASTGMILCVISGTTSTVPDIVGPTHGDESFHSHNRQTTYPSPPGLEIERWKLTQAISIPVSETPFAIIDLAAPVALLWETGTDLIGHGECRVVPEECGPVTLIPNGLAYVLFVRSTTRNTG